MEVEDEEDMGDMGERKMEYFKKKCRELLGPSRVNIKMRVNLDGFQDEDFLDEVLGDPRDHQTYTYRYEGKTLLLNKDYKGTMDIVTAYKSLKQAVSKIGALKPQMRVGLTENTAKPGTSMGGPRKGYLKTTIAAQQHSKNQMN